MNLLKTPCAVAATVLLCLQAPAHGQAPASPVEQRMAELRTAYETVLGDQVGPAHAAAVRDLDANYLSALDRALAAETQAGRLDDALALRGERQRVESGFPLPADDSAAAPALQAIRRTYRTALASLEADLDQKAAPIKAQYDQALEAYQSELTRTGDLDGALAVRTVREALQAASAPAAPASPPPAAGTGAAGTASTPDRAGKENPFENSLGMRFVPVPGTKVLFCIHETRYRDYAAYAAEHRDADDAWRSQRTEGFTVTERGEEHPVWRVSWEDATAFCEWLSRKEGRTYRLPTDEEWSFAAGLGRKERRSSRDTPETLKGRVDDEFPWEGKWPPPPGSGNYSDQSRKAKAPYDGDPYLEDYDDGFPTTAPVMSYRPNPFGLYDLGGNVREWVEDRFNAAGQLRTTRDSCWRFQSRGALLLSNRDGREPDYRNHVNGFRVVLALE